MATSKRARIGKSAEPAGATLPKGYAAFLAGVKTRIATAQIRATLAVSRELLALYWSIGRDLVERQARDGWGSSVVERLSVDLRSAFPAVDGLSARNLWRMRAFYLAYPGPPKTSGSRGREVLPQVVAELPWGHHIVLLEKIKAPEARAWYAHQAIQHGWSRAILVVQVESRLYERSGKAQTNFESTLPPSQSDLANEALKDPYVFDFLTLASNARERDLEQGLTDHVQRFLMELGIGFAFVGRQVHIEVGDQDFYIDLLLYHLKLRCFVVIDLKAVAFRPEFAGKMNFYLSAVDATMRHPEDRPSIGLVLCKKNDRLVVEYALRDMRKPIGVAEWETQLVDSLPKELKGSLPTIEQLEAELAELGGATRRAASGRSALISAPSRLSS